MSLDLTGFRLDRATPTPLYYQIERFLQHGIDSGQIAPGERLPPELELTELFGVSRATVRQAINDLVAKDALYRRKGKGTFVRAPKIRAISPAPRCWIFGSSGAWNASTPSWACPPRTG